MKINMKDYMSQNIEVKRGDYLALAAIGLIQSTSIIVDLVKEHKSRTTKIGIAYRKWLAAEDEYDLYRRELKKKYGKNYDLTTNTRLARLNSESIELFKVWKLMDIEQKIEKLGEKETKKRAKLEESRKIVEQYK